MGAATGGVYCVYWHYCQWRAERIRTGGVPPPLLMAILGPLASFALFNCLRIQARRAPVDCHVAPGWLFLLVCLGIVLRPGSHYLWLTGAARTLPLLPAQAVALRLNRSRDPSDVSPPILDRIDVLFFIPIALLMAAAELNR